MTAIKNEPLVVNSTIKRRGYFTKRHKLGDLDDEIELERRLGFEPGSLSLGWYVLYMIVRPPKPDEFRLGGYTHFSDGHIRGHTPAKGLHVEDSLAVDGVNVHHYKNVSASKFHVDGAERLTKIVPVLIPQSYWHPDPEPIPQWQLKSEMDFLVAAFHHGSRSR